MTWQDIARDFAGGLVDEPDLKVTRRIAKVQSVQQGPPPSLTVTIGATANIAGVRYLGPWQPQVNDYVIVLFAGPDGFAVGKIDPGGATDWIKTTGGGLQAFPARIGASPAGAYGSGYASFDNLGRSWNAPGNYVVLADSVSTYVNAPTGGRVYLRVNNNETGLVTGGGATDIYGNTLVHAANLSIDQTYILYLRGYGDGNHSLYVPTIGSVNSTVWANDGPVLSAFTHLLMVARGGWAGLFYVGNNAGRHLGIEGRLAVGGDSTNDTLQDFETITTYGGASGISMRQRSRAATDGTKRCVWFPSGDTLFLWVDGMSNIFSAGAFTQTMNSISSICMAPPALGGGNTVNIQANGSWQVGWVSSCGKHKTNVRDLDNGGADNPVWRLRPVRFNWHEEHIANGAEINERHPDGVVGLIAEEVAVHAPDAAIYAGRNEGQAWVGSTEDGEPVGLDNDRLIAYLVGAAQHLRDTTAELEARIARLEEEKVA